jgi:succinate-semialdehyde dehydrogenase/glutarate-semialdehyde dehydrogenase
LYDKFVDGFVKISESQVVGDGLNPDTTMGPLAHDRRLDAMEMFVSDAVSKGAKVKTGGKRKGNKGYFFEPTVLTDVPNDAKMMNEEPFGPLAPIVPFKNFDEVVKEANRLPYGLAAFAFTNSAKTAEKISSSIESGIVSINQPWMPVVEVPFGGVKDSGYGKELGSEGLEAYMQSKFITQKSSI